MGVIIGKKCSKIAESEAADYIGGVTLALDMTARDLQEELKAKGHPWSIAKGFDTSCPVGSFIPKEQIQNLERLKIWCKVNDQLRQSGETDKMIFKLNYLISYISKYFTLEVGDVILTGTPKGVGPVKSGDVIQCGLINLMNDKQLIEMKFDVK